MRPRSKVAVLALLTLACSGGSTTSAPPSAPAPTVVSTPVPTPTPAPQLTLSGLFHPVAPTQGDPSHVRTVIATGDVIPARLVNEAATRRGDFAWPFHPTAEYVRSADVTYINLESPLLPGCQVRVLGGDFCGDTRWVSGLTAIGTKVANVANNHVYAGPNVQRTQALLEQNGIQVSTHLGPPAILDVRGLKFAFVGASAVSTGNAGDPQAPPVDRAALKADIEHARQQADVVVVQFHWGKEYERQPQPAGAIAPDDPIELGHLAIDSGADIVIGNHPHWVQGVEIYRNHLITYAHGNYVFDQVNCYPSIGPDYRTYCSDDTRTSVVGTYTFYDKHLVATSWRPTFIDTQLQTQWADPARSAQVLKTMEDASIELAHKQGEPTS